ncbi:hypothetical protein B4907_06710 [Yersinia kristensenii]|nr:hypothetical protein B4907_06710 [Yersinia kristensenii]
MKSPYPPSIKLHVRWRLLLSQIIDSRPLTRGSPYGPAQALFKRFTTNLSFTGRRPATQNI